jgi:hypothetical protein
MEEKIYSAHLRIGKINFGSGIDLKIMLNNQAFGKWK